MILKLSLGIPYCEKCLEVIQERCESWSCSHRDFVLVREPKDYIWEREKSQYLLQTCFTPGLMLMWSLYQPFREIVLSAFYGVKWGSEDLRCSCSLAGMLRSPGCYWPQMTQYQALCLALEYTLSVIVLEPCRSGIRRNATYYDESTNSAEESTRPMNIQRTARVGGTTREGRLLGKEGTLNADRGQEKGDTWLRRIDFWNFLRGGGSFNDKNCI